MGILPLAIDMPMRFTETESRDAGVFKHTRCVLKEIEVDPEEKDRIEACEDAEIALCQQPKHLCVEIETKTGEKKIYRLKPRHVVWYRDQEQQAQVRRKGFILVPDFAGTAHAYCGSTLDQAKGDLLEWHGLPTMGCRNSFTPT